MNEVIGKFEHYLEDLKRKGAKLPSYSNKANPRISVISAVSGVASRHFVTPTFRRRMALALREIGLERPLNLVIKEKAAFEHNCALISHYLNLLEETGLKLPENPSDRGEVFFGQAEIEAGLKHNTLLITGADANDERKILLRQMIEGAAQQLGMEARILLQDKGRIGALITYEFLLHQGTAERKQELEGKPNATQQLYNTRSALSKFRLSHDIQLTDPVGREFVIDFNHSTGKVMEGMSADTSRSVSRVLCK